ncbi:hypothetical protein D9619_005475 [Psilocybe cf. subviscida]|uniref:DASH complex subunit DAD3 n=1 Tax=Psilocybe cf. subviscida TaxID=2480587 RepID=A0A8H5BWQ0_9AGAR|nr:hypothetical protein D9619_005475 [Psilocybe cf. subviscida]
MSTHASSASDILTVNIYEGHPSLTPLEATALWEYAKLAYHLTQRTRALTEEPDRVMLAKLRILEKKMGLVLTLFKASVWGVINEQPEPSMHSGSYNDDNDTTIRH